MKLKTVQKVIFALYGVMLVCWLLMAVTKSLLFAVPALAAVFIQPIFKLLYWKCPHCGKFLGKQLGPQHCRNCGEKVEL